MKMNILLLGCYTLFSCYIIKRNSQRSKLTIPPHPTPLPHPLPSYWMKNSPIYEFHDSLFKRLVLDQVYVKMFLGSFNLKNLWTYKAVCGPTAEPLLYVRPKYYQTKKGLKTKNFKIRFRDFLSNRTWKILLE